MVSFERSGPKVLLIEHNFAYRARSDDANERQAVEESFAKSVIWGFEVVGLAADDLEKVQEFLDEVQVDFPIVYGDLFDVMDISAEYGNSFGGLPFSVFIDRDGNIRYIQKPGEVTFEEAEEILKRLL